MKCNKCGYEWDYTSRNGIKRKYIVCPVCRANLKNPSWTDQSQKMDVEDIKEIIKPVLLKYHIKRAIIFGSFARGEQRKESDLDLLVDFDYSKMSGLDYVHLWKELEEKLGIKVDLVSWNYINPMIKEDVEKEGIKAL